MLIALSVTALAESGASTALNQEIVGWAKTIGMLLFLFLVSLYIIAPLGGFLFSQKLAKKKAESDQEEQGGIKTLMWGLGGAIMGFMAMFVINGYIGSMIQDGKATIDFVDGNKYIMSRVLGTLLDTTKNSLDTAQ